MTWMTGRSANSRNRASSRSRSPCWVTRTASQIRRIRPPALEVCVWLEITDDLSRGHDFALACVAVVHAAKADLADYLCRSQREYRAAVADLPFLQGNHVADVDPGDQVPRRRVRCRVDPDVLRAGVRLPVVGEQEVGLRLHDRLILQP